MAEDTRKRTDRSAGDTQTANEGVERLTRGLEGAARFGQENLEAVVISSRIAAKAHETVGAEVAAFTKKSYEDGLAATKDLTASKSLTEMMEKQTAYAKAALESYVSEATKINDIYVAATKEAFAPLNERFTKSVEMVRGGQA